MNRLTTRGGFVFMAVGATAVAFSQQTAGSTALGTKPDVIVNTPDKAAPLVDATALIQLCVALAVVYGLVKFVLPKMMSKFGSKVNPELGGTIRTCETAACGTSTLQVLEVRGKTLLVSVSPAGVSLISDLTDSTDARANDATPAFFEMLDARKQEPVEALYTKAVVETYEPKLQTRLESKPESRVEPKKDDFEESLRLLTEAKAKMAARTETAPADESESRIERLRRLTG